MNATPLRGIRRILAPPTDLLVEGRLPEQATSAQIETRSLTSLRPTPGADCLCALLALHRETCHNDKRAVLCLHHGANAHIFITEPRNLLRAKRVLRIGTQEKQTQSDKRTRPHTARNGQYTQTVKQNIKNEKGPRNQVQDQVNVHLSSAV